MALIHLKKTNLGLSILLIPLIMLVLNSAIQPLHIKLREYKIANFLFFFLFYWCMLQLSYLE